MLDISTANHKEAIRKENEFKAQMAALEAQRDWDKRHRARREQERLDAIPKWHLWLLTHMPRAWAVLLITILKILFFIGGLLLFALCVAGVILGFQWLSLTDPQALHTIWNLFIAVVVIVSMCRAIWAFGMNVYYKTNEALPKREKKHD